MQDEQNRKQNFTWRFTGTGQVPYRGGCVDPPCGLLIHLLVTQEYYGFATYLGLRMLANFVGTLVSAVGI